MSEKTKDISDDLREVIEDIRRANHGIRACIRLLPAGFLSPDQHPPVSSDEVLL